MAKKTQSLESIFDKFVKVTYVAKPQVTLNEEDFKSFVVKTIEFLNSKNIELTTYTDLKT